MTSDQLVELLDLPLDLHTSNLERSHRCLFRPLKVYTHMHILTKQLLYPSHMRQGLIKLIIHH